MTRFFCGIVIDVSGQAVNKEECLRGRFLLNQIRRGASADFSAGTTFPHWPSA
jgi:hypothetical protein